MPYEVDGWAKYAEVDSFEHGCDPDSYTQFGGSDSWHANTIPALIEQLRQFVPFASEGDAVQLDACEEPGRVDICGMETNDSQEPTKAEIEKWKRGEYTLYYVVYTFYVEKVTREIVSLTPAAEEVPS